MKVLATLLVCLAILGGAGAATWWIFARTSPSPKPSTKKTAMLVEVVEASRGDFRPTIVAMGAVEAERDVILSPRISGEVLERAPGFDPGGMLAKGDVLLRIDPADHEIRLRQRRTDLRRAEAALELELGRQEIARQDFEVLDRELTPENAALVLREPQLETARADVEAARAAVEQAELDVERTVIRAPFDAHVLSRDVDVGSQVAPGDRLGRLVGLDAYRVVARVPLSKLRWIDFPREPGEVGATAYVRDRAAWGPDERREGHVERLIGALDEETRLGRVLVSVPDPLASGPAAGAPPLTIGAFVEVLIEGREVADVVRIDRDLVRQGDTAWVFEDGVLRVRRLELALEDASHAYVTAGLEAGDRIVTTDLATVVDGAPLRLAEDAPEPGGPAEPEGGA